LNLHKICYDFAVDELVHTTFMDEFGRQIAVWIPTAPLFSHTYV